MLFFQIVHRLNNGRRSEIDEVKPDLVSGAGDTVIKLNVGGTSFRIRISSIFARSADEKLSAFAQLNHEQRLQACDAFLMVGEAPVGSENLKMRRKYIISS